MMMDRFNPAVWLSLEVQTIEQSTGIFQTTVITSESPRLGKIFDDDDVANLHLSATIFAHFSFFFS